MPPLPNGGLCLGRYEILWSYFSKVDCATFIFQGGKLKPRKNATTVMKKTARLHTGDTGRGETSKDL